MRYREIIFRSRRPIIRLLMLCALASSAMAQAPTGDALSDISTELVPLAPAARDIFIADGRHIRAVYDTGALHLAPLFARPIVDQLIQPDRPPGAAHLLVEGLFLIPLTSEQQAATTDLLLYNITRSISTMKGIDYYSASRQAWRIFYIDSHVVASPTDPQPIPDPLALRIPPKSRLYLRQRDSSFGINYYEGRYIYDNRTIAVDITNLRPMRYFIFQFADTGDVRTIIVIRRVAEGVLFYSVADLTVGSFFGFRERVERSFTNRLVAIYRWFESRLRAELML